LQSASKRKIVMDIHSFFGFIFYSWV